MINIKGKEGTAVYLGKRAIQSIYQGGAIVWQAIRSCFGSGHWANEKPWLDNEPWKN